MISYRILPAAFVIGMLSLPSFVAAQDAQELEQYEQFATPGEPHKQMQRLVGKWKAEVKYFFDETSEPTVSEATATFNSLLGGRYLQQRFSGDMQGQKFSGIAISGYDNAKQKYVGIWIDDMSTGIMHSEGTYDVETNTMTEIAVASSPRGEMKYKNVSHYKSDDEFTFTMYMILPDGERKMMDITYTRVE